MPIVLVDYPTFSTRVNGQAIWLRLLGNGKLTFIEEVEGLHGQPVACCHQHKADEVPIRAATSPQIWREMRNKIVKHFIIWGDESRHDR